jgi:hypothetical protein
VFKEAHQPGMADRIKERTDIGVQYDAHQGTRTSGQSHFGNQNSARSVLR